MKALEFLKPLNWLLTIDKSTQHNNLEQLNNRILLSSKNYVWSHFSKEEYLQNNYKLFALRSRFEQNYLLEDEML